MVVLPDYKRSIRVNLDISDVVRMRLPCLHLLHCVIVVHTKVHVIRACYDPLLPHNKFSTSDWHFAHLEWLNQCLHVARAIVKLCYFRNKKRVHQKWHFQSELRQLIKQLTKRWLMKNNSFTSKTQQRNYTVSRLSRNNLHWSSSPRCKHFRCTMLIRPRDAEIMIRDRLSVSHWRVINWNFLENHRNVPIIMKPINKDNPRSRNIHFIETESRSCAYFSGIDINGLHAIWSCRQLLL